MKNIRKYCSMLTIAFSIMTIITGCSSNKQTTKASEDLKNLSLDNYENNHKGNLDDVEYFKYSGDITIGFSMGSLRDERWQKDRDAFLSKAKELHANVRMTNANNDKRLQISQAEKLIAEGVNVLVVVPIDAKESSEIVDKAHKAHIKVLSYDRLITDCDVDYYASYDNEEVGKLQAEEMLKAVPNGNIAYIGGSETDNNAILFRKGTMETLSDKIKNNSISLIMDKYTPDWNRNEAYKTVNQLITTNKNKIDGIICASDAISIGALQALKENGLDGKIPLTGQDAELEACKNIVAEKQLMTIYKPVNKLADKAVEMAINMAQNKSVNTNSKIYNGFKDVDAYLLKPIVVNRDNLKDTVIRDNWVSETDVYKNSKE